MCGRAYSTYSEEELYFRYLNRKGWPWKLGEKISVTPNYNICPTQSCPVLSAREGKLEFNLMRWGLVPSWAKSVKDADKYSMINARSEEIAEKRSYKAAFRKTRCIIPVSGFYEWKRTEKVKQPFAIFLKDEAIMSLAGICEQWIDKESSAVVNSFALVTTSANTFMSKIHDRMPIILTEDEEQLWLDPEITDPERMAPLLKGCHSERLDCYEVSAAVNSPKNNSPEVLNRL